MVLLRLLTVLMLILGLSVHNPNVRGEEGAPVIGQYEVVLLC